MCEVAREFTPSNIHYNYMLDFSCPQNSPISHIYESVFTQMDTSKAHDRLASKFFTARDLLTVRGCEQFLQT